MSACWLWKDAVMSSVLGSRSEGDAPPAGEWAVVQGCCEHSGGWGWGALGCPGVPRLQLWASARGPESSGRTRSGALLRHLPGVEGPSAWASAPSFRSWASDTGRALGPGWCWLNGPVSVWQPVQVMGWARPREPPGVCPPGAAEGKNGGSHSIQRTTRSC